MVDTHTHLNFRAFDGDWQKIVELSLKADVTKMIVVGTDLDSSQKAIELANNHPALFASVGIHPHHAKQYINLRTQLSKDLAQLKDMATHKRVVAIGEVGLDYHYYQKSRHVNKIVSPQLIELQKEILAQQIMLAANLKKPLILHSREAHSDVLDLISNLSLDIGHSLQGVFHCFDGSKKYAKRIIDQGFYISFTGNITYNSDRLDVANTIPLNRLLLETDCPFMKPKSKNSKELRSLPSDVKITGLLHAKSRKIPKSELFDATTNNAHQLFNFSKQD